MSFENWLETNLPRHNQLTDVVKTITENLLIDDGIEYLSIVGRTKTLEGVREKLKRKSYGEPQKQLTDISGIRIILFIESDIAKVSEIIEASFEVDRDNSSNTDEKLDPNQVGYRSVHYVCELGSARTKLPEFKNLENLKFEFQIRTVLQHAWAELAHDRSYKFQADLPQDIQRKLYLHAGLLEIADKGFSEIAQEIDSYAEKVTDEYDSGNLDIPINSISLTEYFDSWSKTNEIKIHSPFEHLVISDLIRELSEFEIHTIKDLSDIEPIDYVKELKNLNIETNIYGIIRDWMIIENPKKILSEIERDWVLGTEEDNTDELALFYKLIKGDKLKDFENGLDR